MVWLRPCLVAIWFAMPLSIASGQGLPPGFEVPSGDPASADVPVRRVSGRSKLLYSSDASQKSMQDVFRQSTMGRERIVYVDCDFLMRRIQIEDEKVHEPIYYTGKLKEHHLSGDLQIESIKFRSGRSTRLRRARESQSALDKQEKATKQTREETWAEEKKRLQRFVAERLVKEDYGPDVIEMAPISSFFHLDEHVPETGGVFVSTSEMSLVGRLGSRSVTIDAPGMSMPTWISYFDPRAAGFANQVELKRGSTVDEVLRRLNTGVPFSVETIAGKPFATVAFAMGMKRMLFDPAKGYLPIYSVNFRGGERSKHKAILVFVKNVQLQSWVNGVEISGHWVPKRIRVLTPSELIDVEIMWFNVNKGMPESEFGIDTIQLPPGTRVLDRRTVPPQNTILYDGSNWNPVGSALNETQSR